MLLFAVFTLPKSPAIIIIDNKFKCKRNFLRVRCEYKERIRAAGVYQWEIAEALGITEFTMVRWLRRPESLTRRKYRELKAIREITAQKAMGKLENKIELISGGL